MVEEFEVSSVNEFEMDITRRKVCAHERTKRVNSSALKRKKR